ncbi:MAG: hypothetical protein CL916_13755 [Deltaproteobacteria bacterium]|nr:hypothetical protein [Deltaproteobacteria bacterium]
MSHQPYRQQLFDGDVMKSELNRRKLLSILSAGGTATILPSCATFSEYHSNTWWIKEGYAPLQEEFDRSNLRVEGEIPKHIHGLYVRNGGNFRGGNAPHYFVGDGMLHGIWFKNGKPMHYRNRWVQTSLVKDGKKMSIDKKDNMSNTSIIAYGGKLLSLMEIGFPYEINSDLSTKGVYRFDNTLEAAMTAHPKVHPTTQNLQFYGMSFFSNPFLHYREANENGEITKRIDIDLPGSSMQHDFQRTENYVIFLDLPIVFSKMKAVMGQFPYSWQGDKYRARLGLFPRTGTASDVRWFDIKTGFCFHTANAFEKKDGTVIVQLSHFKKLWVRSPYDINFPSQLYQYHIHPQKGILSEGPCDDLRVDFGFVDSRFAGIEHQKLFFSTLTPTGSQVTDPVRFSGVVCYNQQGTRLDKFTYPDEFDCGEFTFIPKSHDALEGEGNLIGFVYNRRNDTSTLDFFDAENVSIGPIARVHIGNRVPFGFHGTFVNNAEFL